MSDRPPAFPSKASLARELDCAESTVDEMVRRGILPKPRRLTPGCVRWCWAEIERALDSLKDGQSDPYAAGVAKLGDEDGKKAKGRG
jgi:predicted DNA-binding transcriptional regulator AlpA